MLFDRLDDIVRRCCLGCILSAAVLFGTATETNGQGWVRVTSNMEGAIVLLDSANVGQVGSVIECSQGPHHVLLLPPVQDSWFFTRPSTKVEIVHGDTAEVVLEFPYIYQIETSPDDAKVLLISENGHISLGATPLLLRRERPIQEELLFKKEGFYPQRLIPPAEVFNKLAVVLRLQNGIPEEEAKPVWHTPGRHRRWVNYGAAAVAIASGAIAAHYKLKADNIYDEYAITGNPELRQDIRRYDAYSAVALGTMQVGIGVLAIRLILRK